MPNSVSPWHAEAQELADLGGARDMIESASNGQETQADPSGKGSHPSQSSHKEPTTPRTLVLGQSGPVSQDCGQGPRPRHSRPTFPAAAASGG